MKNSISLKLVVSLALLIGSIFMMQSCAKSKARKDIEGTWTFVSSTVDGAPNPIAISGTYEFKKCSGSDNRKGSCEMIQDVTLEYQGVTETTYNTLNYRIIKGQKGLELLIDDATFMFSVTESSLTLTSFENEETLVMNFTK